MTDDQIEQVRASEDPETAALSFVDKDKATLIRFSHGAITGRCGREQRSLTSHDADDVGGWKYVFSRIDFDSWENLSFLHLDDESIILPGSIKEDPVETFMHEVQFVLGLLHDEDDMGRKLLSNRG